MGADAAMKSPPGEERALHWPRKYDLFSVQVSATTYEEVLPLLVEAARKGLPVTVAHLAVHGLVSARCHPDFLQKINSFTVAVPDGHPVRWALNLLYGTRLPDRVYGPELMLRLCGRAAELGIGVYLYGSQPQVVERLRARLMQEFPRLRIVGCESPPFRPLTPEEDRAVIERIHASSAGIVFVGLGCPKQESFAYEHRDSIRAVQIGVGAAFDFISGHKPTAPRRMQRHGLEWLYRLLTEPRRLLWRYLWTNTVFAFLLAGSLLRRRRRGNCL